MSESEFIILYRPIPNRTYRGVEPVGVFTEYIWCETHLCQMVEGSRYVSGCYFYMAALASNNVSPSDPKCSPGVRLVGLVVPVAAVGEGEQ